MWHSEALGEKQYMRVLAMQQLMVGDSAAAAALMLSELKKMGLDPAYQRVETCISEHSEVTFSHGVCPACAEEYEHQFEVQKNRRESAEP